jgi:hypothetical protein
MPVQESHSRSYKATSSSSSTALCSSLMCCSSDKDGRTYTTSYREQSQSKFLWLDPTRWVEKRAVKHEKVGQ